MRPWKNRTTVTLAAMVLLLGLGLVTRTLAANQPEPASAEAASVLATQEETGDFFRDFRAQRETARADEIALLDEIVHREGAPEESVREADARRIELTRQTEQERASGRAQAVASLRRGLHLGRGHRPVEVLRHVEP